MRRRVRGVLGTAAALCVVGLVANPVGADQADPASCAVSDRTLIVSSHGDDLTLTREANKVAVIGAAGLACEGGTRRLDKLDSIRINGGDLVDVDLRNGPLAPGATPESDGTDEIEVHISKSSYPEVKTSHDPQRIDLGTDSSGGVTVDFEPVAGAPEADIAYGPNREMELELRTGRGDDLLDARDSTAFLAILARSGDDRLLGPETEFGRRAFYYLVAGPGNDFVDGGSGFDLIDGGRGDDVLRSHRGVDLVAPRGGHDTADCGPGRDFFYLASPKRDDVSNCERRWIPN